MSKYQKKCLSIGAKYFNPIFMMTHYIVDDIATHFPLIHIIHRYIVSVFLGFA